MGFEQCTYATLPRQPPQPTFGELYICTPFSDGLSTFIQDDRLLDDVYHLRYVGHEVVSLTSLVQVNLAYSSGVPALTGNYLVDMLHRAFPPTPKSSSPTNNSTYHFGASPISSQAIFWAHHLLRYFRSHLPPFKTIPPSTHRHPPTSTPYTTTSLWP